VPGFCDKNVKDIRVIVSDVALDAKAQADQFVRISLGNSGKLHAFEMVIERNGKPVATSWRHNGFKGPQPSGLSSDDVFPKNVLDDKFIEGGYKSAKDGEFSGNTYAFDVTFRTLITLRRQARLWEGAIHDERLAFSKPLPQSAPKMGTYFGSSQAILISKFNSGTYAWNWRRERDSNPRYGFPQTHFPGVRLQPLGHPSRLRTKSQKPNVVRSNSKRRATMVCIANASWDSYARSVTNLQILVESFAVDKNVMRAYSRRS
jgi:hypothetical protein